MSETSVQQRTRSPERFKVQDGVIAKRNSDDQILADCFNALDSFEEITVSNVTRHDYRSVSATTV